MSFTITQEWKSKLLRRPKLMRTDVRARSVEPAELETVRRLLGKALAKGLRPGGFSVTDDALVLRFGREEG